MHYSIAQTFKTMNNIILFDGDNRNQLLPLTFTRPVAEIRMGILTITQKWEHSLGGTASHITQDYLAEKFPLAIEAENYIINGSVLPSTHLVRLIKGLSNNEALLTDGELVAAKLDKVQFDRLMRDEDIEELLGFEIGDTPLVKIDHLWDIFRYNHEALAYDFELLTQGRTSAPIDPSNRAIEPKNIFIEAGAEVSCAILNAKDAPIYIGKNAVVMEGAMVRGGLALCEGAVLKMGAKIYGATTIGPYSKVGGEVSNSVILANSNKAHDGYLGNSIIGEWCNLGADTNASNLKNSYENIKIWDYSKEDYADSRLQFCGLVMGDHSKCGINTMFNTGTVVGVCSNIFGEGFPPRFVPSFSWGGKDGLATYRLDKALQTATKVVARRNAILGEAEKKIIAQLFEQTKKFRTWEADLDKTN